MNRFLIWTVNATWNLGTKIELNFTISRMITCSCKSSHALVTGDLFKKKNQSKKIFLFIFQLCQTMWSGRSHFPFAEKKPFFRLSLFWYLQSVHLLERTSTTFWNSGCTSSLILTASPNCQPRIKEWVSLYYKDFTWLLLLAVQLESVMWALYSFAVSKLRNASSYLVTFPDDKSESY